MTNKEGNFTFMELILLLRYLLISLKLEPMILNGHLDLKTLQFLNKMDSIPSDLVSCGQESNLKKIGTIKPIWTKWLKL